MKKLVLLQVLSLVMLQLAAQTKTVTIRGTVADTTVHSIEVSHLVDAGFSEWASTRLPLVDGAFHSSFQVPYPVEINIITGPRAYGKIFIYGDAGIRIDSTGKPQITGSPVQDEYENEFVPFFRPNDERFDSLRSFYGNNHQKYGPDFPKAIKDSAHLLAARYYTQRADLLAEYIRRHPDSYVALWDISNFVALTPTHPYFDFDKLFASFSSGMQQHSFIPALKKKLKTSAWMQAGQKFPAAFFKGYESMQRAVGSHSKYYLVDFWYSHCGPCASEFPKLSALYRRFHAKGFDIVSISVDKPKDQQDYREAIKKYALTWNHVWDRGGVNAEKYSIHSFPTYILLDSNHRVIKADIRPPELEAFLDANL
ncbi:MAG: AhpC/TSA family protein [Chitinophagaceae bacterium]|nr:MAG: AhpC/TSA family protein [Chitinophagaceae bacterium]